ncbi:hypothetical protein AB7M17_001315 [Bradyrhizobium sp. USDA 377]
MPRFKVRQHQAKYRRVRHLLARRQPDWGVRDVGDVEKLAKAVGLGLVDTIEMPANNLTLVFER